MSNCKLYETLSKCYSELDEKHNPESYNCTDKCPHFQKCFYKYKCPPDNKNLQEFFGGWQKYCLISIESKDVTFKNSSYPIVNILHLISPQKIDDIVIFRVAKKNKEGQYQIRYLAKQSHKEMMCANIDELNTFIENKYSYCGRKLTKEDFTNV